MSQAIRRCSALIAFGFTFLAGGTVLAQDDGPRTYWKGLAGANVVAFQYLPFNGDTLGSQSFNPANFFYPESEIQANLFFLTYARHFTLFDRAAIFGANVIGGNVDVESFEDPFEETPDIGFGQGAQGFGDPSVQLTVNLFGTPAIKSLYDVSKYEPKVSLDVSAMGSMPIGEYDSDKVVNLGLNRWWTRLALPFTYHIGPFVPGYRTSVEVVPAVYLFGSNDDFLGGKLENEALYQIEAHVTRDFATKFFGSLDVMFRHGALAEIGGVNFGEKLSVLSAGFTLDYAVTDNIGLRVSYHSLVGGGSNIDGDMLRLNVNFAWHPLLEKIKKLGGNP